MPDTNTEEAPPVLHPAELDKMLQDPEFHALSIQDRKAVSERGIAAASNYISQNGGWTPELWQKFGEMAGQTRQHVNDSESGLETAARYAGVAGQTVKDLPVIVSTTALGLSPVVPDGKPGWGVKGQVPGETLVPAFGRNMASLGASAAAAMSSSEKPVVKHLDELKQKLDDGEFLTHKEGLHGWLDEQNAALQKTQAKFYGDEDWAQQNSLLGNPENTKLLRAYLQTRSPQAWGALKAQVLQTPFQARLQGDKAALENDTALGQALKPEVRPMISEAADPAELLPGLMAAKQGAKALAKGATKTQRAIELGKGLAGEMMGEQVSASIDNPYLSWEQRLQVAKDSLAGALGLMGAGGAVQAGLNKLTGANDGNVSPNETAAAAATDQANGAAAEAAAMGGSAGEAGAVTNPLAGIAQRAGAVDVAGMTNDEAAMPNDRGETGRVQASRPVFPRPPGLAAAAGMLQGQGLVQQSAVSSEAVGQSPERAGVPELPSPALLAQAHEMATRGSSTPMVPISSVFNAAQQLQPGLTPEAFIQGVKAADDSGHVFLEPPERPETIHAAGPFVLRNASGIPSTSMMMAPDRVSMSKPGAGLQPMQRLHQFWQDYANDPNHLRRGPTATQTALPQIVSHYATPGEVQVSRLDKDGKLPGVAQAWRLDFKEHTGKPLHAFVIHSEDGHVHVNTEGMKGSTKARGGDLVYQSALTYAHNNGLKFRPDPEGVSGIAHLRRLGHLLSSALRHGTTRHIEPRHARPELSDVPAEAWHEGEHAHAGNVAVLAEHEARGVFDAAAQRGVDLSQLHYDAASNTIQDATGRSLRNRDVTDTLAKLDSATSGVGETASLRAVVSQSALQGHAIGRGLGLDDGHHDVRAGNSTAAGSGIGSRSPDGIYHPLRPNHPLLASKPGNGKPVQGRLAAASAALEQLRKIAPVLGRGVRLVQNRDGLRAVDFHADDWADFAGPNATEAFFDPKTGEVTVLADNLVVREGETLPRALARVILHESIGHAGLAALRQMDPTFAAKWDKIVSAIENEPALTEEIAALREQGYGHLDDSQLVEEWFARQVEQLTPQQLQALQPQSALGRLWQWLKDALGHLTRSFSRTSWLTREMQEVMTLSRQALERGGPLGMPSDGRVKQGRILGAIARTIGLHEQGTPFRVKALGWQAIVTGRPLPKDLVRVLDMTENERQAVMQASAQVSQDLQTAVKAYLDRTGKDELALWKHIADVMEGKPGAASLLGLIDPVVMERTRRARNMLDDLSQGVAQTLPTGDLRTKIIMDQGSWMRRGYAAFDPDSGWNFDNVMKAAAAGRQVAGRDVAQIVATARNYLRTQNPQNGRTVKAWNDDIEADMRDLMDREQWESAMVSGSGVKKNVSSFMHRKDIAPEIRALMGEETNPLHRFVQSARFQAQIIARHHGQLAMRQLGLTTGLFSAERGGVYTEKITSDGHRWSGLQGVWTTPQLLQALERTNSVDLAGTDLGGKVLELLKALGNEAKLNRVALNPDSWVVNIIGNVVGLVQSGDVFAWDFVRRMRDARALIKSGKAKPGAVLNAAQEAIMDMQRTMLARLRGMGVVGSSITLNDIEASIPKHLLQWVAEDEARNRALGAAKGALMGQALGRGLGLPGRAVGAVAGAVGGGLKGAKGIQELQQKIADYVMTGPDALARVTGFLTNYESALASGMGTDDAANWATTRTLNTFPNYSALPAPMRQLSRLGFMGSFIAFQYEVYRNFGWNLVHGMQELRSGNAAMTSRGLRRLAGVGSVAALAGGGLAMLLAATGGGTGTDDERNKKWRRWFAAPWEKDAVLAFDKFDKDGVSYYNTSYLLPQVTMMELIQAARDGKDPAEGAGRVVDRLLEQFVNGSVHLQPLIAAALNQDRNGRKITNRDGAEGLVIRADSAMETILEPGFAAKITRMVYALREAEKNGRSYSIDEEMKRMAGVRQVTRTWEEMVKRRYSKFSADYMGEREEANKMLAENLPGAAVKAVARVNARVEVLKKDLQDFEIDLNRLGVPAATVAKAKKDSSLVHLNPVRVRADGKRVEAVK